MTNILSKFYNLIKSYQHSIFLSACIILVAFIGYNLGIINSRGKLPVTISAGNNVYQASAVTTVTKEGKVGDSNPIQATPVIRDMRVIASKNSTAKKYHFLWCPSAKKIKDENRVWFASAQEAESQGYTLAGNCTQ